MDFQTIFRRLGVQSSELRTKAEELFRLSKVRCPGGLGPGELGRSLICVDIASQLVEEKISRKEAISISGLNEKIYRQTLSKLQNILNIKPVVTLKELAIQYGCVRLVPLADAVLKEYTVRLTKSMSEHQRQFIDLQRPVYPIACFYLASKKMKIRVDKKQMMSTSNVTQQELSKVCQDILSHCFDIVGVKRKRTEEDKEQDKEQEQGTEEIAKESAANEEIILGANDQEDRNPNEGAETKPASQEYVKLRRFQRDRSEKKESDYEEWKKKILQSLGPKSKANHTQESAKQSDVAICDDSEIVQPTKKQKRAVSDGVATQSVNHTENN